ncbi:MULTISPECIES: response regulator transcription factor [Kangiella]|uniref:Response regulator receiver protein n=1 Tax=Kangiella sediminilitoris TaxID=1144748 RepID=A0A1B3BDI3_9GAMM|nr:MULTISPECIES: response regulator [Kangiella]AOE50872.1 Response regulator receiver protein [Kangiella sediminilitoris]
MARVLIVDDSPAEAHSLTKMLEKNGHQVITAPDGESGIASAKANTPDLILMDVVMPGLNGFQATRQLKKDSSTSAIPIIIVSTKSQATDRVWGMRQGANDYITKPVDESALVESINNVLGS